MTKRRRTVCNVLDYGTLGRANKATVEVSIGSSGWLDFDGETTITFELTRGRPGALRAVDRGDDQVELRIRGYSERTALLRALEVAIAAVRREIVAAHRSTDAARRANHA